jgi:hypothetical protein
VDAVNAMALDGMDAGETPAKAYSQAFNWLASKDPTVGSLLAQVVTVIEASDDATVAQYGAALDHFVATGDEGQIDALASMMSEDMDALDSREDAAEAPSASPAPIRQTFPSPTPEGGPEAPQPTSQSGPGSYRSVAGKAVQGNGSVSYSAPKSGVDYARSVGLPLAYTGPPIEA